MAYMIWDLETENHEKYKRFANSFYHENYVVARGWKIQGDAHCSYSYHGHKDGAYTHIPEHVTMLVGHNLKFDLMYEWDNPELIAFFKRGGRIWDTMYAEYLLEAMHPDSHMTAMDDIIEKYGGRLKINAVKELWEAGFLTSQIDKDLLIDYLVGTEAEKRNSGDIGNTELIFLGQLPKAQAEGMIPMMMARMDGLCALTEMEWNGIKIDVAEALRMTDVLNHKLVEVEEELKQYIPPLPEALVFNWASRVHCSSLIFGGTIKYKERNPYIDEETGEFARLKAKSDWPLFDGEPVDPSLCTLGVTADLWRHGDKVQDTFISGVKKGQPKFKKVDVEGELKIKWQDYLFKLDGYTTPNPEWQGQETDGAGLPIYATNADVIEELAVRNIPFLVALQRRADIVKDLGTYYVRWDEKKKDYKGMLTCVMPESHIIHHNLNPVNTVTSRLSSNNPNLQNVPRGDTSEVKKMFISRFENGVMMEVDYSQLEVVVQGLLSGDKNLCEDLRNRIDFHCKRVAAKFGVTYEEALYRCKDKEFVDHVLWKNHRTKCKEFSFQRAYGAGASKIALTTGMAVEDVRTLIDLEDQMYPGVTAFNKRVADEVAKTAVPFKDWTKDGKTYRRGYWRSPTGTKYTFRTYDAMEYQQERGIKDSFMPTEMKNYPVQGTGGEIVQIVLGRLWRFLLSMDNYDGKCLLCNTVHDCVWLDVTNDIVSIVGPQVQRIMESVPELLKELYGMDCTVPFPVEVEIGPNLYDKEVIHF